MSDLTDARLREAYARAASERADATRAACPAPEALERIVAREGTEDERIAALDHVLACPHCRAELELLRSIREAGGAHGAARARRPWAPWAAMAIAASLLLAVWIGPGRRYLEPGGFGADQAVRGGDGDIEIVQPASGAAVPTSAPLVVTWHAAEGATRYTLELLAPDGTVMLSQRTPDTTITIPASRLPMRGDYRLWVREATGSEAERRSAMRRLRIE